MSGSRVHTSTIPIDTQPDPVLDSAQAERLFRSLWSLLGIELSVVHNGAGGAPVVVAGKTIAHVTAEPPSAEAEELAAQLLSERAAAALELEGVTGELLDRYEELTLLYELGQALGSMFDVPTACEAALERAVRVVTARKALLYLANETGDELVLVAWRGEEGRPTVALGKGIAGYVAATGRQLLLHPDELAPESARLPGTSLDAVLSVPLAYGEAETLGSMTLCGRGPGDRFSAADAKLCTAVATQLATSIHNSRLVESLRKAEGVRREVEIAAGIQRGLLPRSPPQVEGVEIAGRCHPAANVGGDYYDVLVDAEGRVSLLIADVAGHSIGSALMMATARSVLRREVAEGHAPAEVLAATNAALYDDLVYAQLFITVFCARYDPAARRLEYANGGHNPPILWRASGESRELDADGAAIGILPEPEFEPLELELEPGDVLLLYTDGVVEACSPGGEEFGEERLRDVVAAAALTPVGQLADGLYAAVRGYVGVELPHDDITLLALKAT